MPAMRTHLLALSLLACTLPAQIGTATVCITGRVLPVSGPTICMQGETHYLECTRVFLRSLAIDLTRLEGRLVRLVGRDIGVTCRVLEVVAAMPPIATLATCGTPSIGCPIKLKVCPGGLGLFWTFVALRPGFHPLGCGGLPGGFEGTVLLGQPAVTNGSGPLGAGCGEVIQRIPTDPNLVGLDVWFQGARVDIGPVGPFQLTNVECIRIGPPGPPCALPNC